MSLPSLADLLRLPPYQAYSYSYPHKTSYRPLQPAVPLSQVWADERRQALFLYLHIPFCSYRCGFCNLFALARPAPAQVEAYLAQMERQLQATVQALGAHRFVRFAMGGGTPSYLDAAQLRRVFDMVARHATIALDTIPAGIEVSPETVDAEKLQVLRQAGIDRVSMGIQSFSAAEVSALVRPQQRETVERAIDIIRAQGITTLNLDLIYGIAGQTVESFLASIDSALQHAPEELYLYPLYVRPMTGLGRIEAKAGGRRSFVLQPEPLDERLALYRAGRDRLLAAGYTQISMRMFRAPHAPDGDAPVYCCQSDGMVGIGCGARSYTAGLHYSSEYGVSRRSVADILEHYLQRDPASFARADYGIALDADDARRRHAIQSLLVVPGLDRDDFRQRFGMDCLDALPQLQELLALGLAQWQGSLLSLTAAGMERADTIGPWLTSAPIVERMQQYQVG
ncbi:MULTISPECIES: STM4012 family radical SAM protein [Xanthomonas]|uniref:Coproporphyrinogen III oxidase n=1 Tax=Xanthomonas phaseoli pv. dieffenbachiae TaxID=92828 RepID=A0A1V9HDZ4_9XANT|nr:STM4012 family radical SAM protein [Xanthomonas phaseoli]MBO9766835.1 STM4012 family radical SAM protein [Xanthomonas phaseoli pv. dieffenbachiae]MBO9777249.1 STM4012 family radical SAM protein [Xanthomonas phaseoli pv. dieffenbachiae]MBO9780491.1 STM4012 family radical SAM protein [Xanthomonas phaseoli pv. dieffenbachiae]MBO9790263.1 STM4012 family radical SAM protein [Xanthomonas phaseoli pv. dieffenbachiae]MBO9796670.1 STM4012 family radical SAM protein [Xanthomonas phaseoli pv. dieffenb